MNPNLTENTNGVNIDVSFAHHDVSYVYHKRTGIIGYAMKWHEELFESIYFSYLPILDRSIYSILSTVHPGSVEFVFNMPKTTIQLLWNCCYVS